MGSEAASSEAFREEAQVRARHTPGSPGTGAGAGVFGARLVPRCTVQMKPRLPLHRGLGLRDFSPEATLQDRAVNLHGA